MNVRVAVILLVAAVMGAAADGPVFTTASVKPGIPQPMSCGGGPGTPAPGRFTCTYATLAMLIAVAWDVPPDQITGPDWIRRPADGFDVEATIPPGASRTDFRQMLRNLLTERFHLVVREESRQADVYTLQVSAQGAKLKEGTTHIPPVLDRIVNGQILIEGRGATMSTLAAVLTRQLHSRVNDETMLPGTYDFTVIASDLAQLGKALEDQLGLQLPRTTATIRTVIVEDTLRRPTEN